MKRPSPALFFALLALVFSSASISQAQSGRDPVIIGGNQASLNRIHSANLREAARLAVEQTNQFRESHNLEALSVNAQLQATAQSFAEFMARTSKYGHTADGRAPHERATAQGYEYSLVLENIGNAFRTNGFGTEELAHLFVDGWINSPSHRENMLHQHPLETAVAFHRSQKDGTYYAVQLFGRPKSWILNYQVKNLTGKPITYLSRNEDDPKTQQSTELPVRTSIRSRSFFPTQVRFPWMQKGVWMKVEEDKTYSVYQERTGRFVVQKSGSR